MKKKQLLEEAKVSILLHNSGAQPCTDSGQPTPDEIVTVLINVENPGCDDDFTLFVELLEEIPAWIIDDSNPNARTKTNITFPMHGAGEASFSMASSKPGPVTVAVHIDYEDGSKSKEFEQKVHFSETFPDTIELDLSNDDAQADGRATIVAIATAKKDGTPVEGVTVKFELHQLDSAARFLVEAGIDIQPDSDDKIASGQTNENGQVQISFTDTISETGALVGYYKTDTEHNTPTKERPFKFRWPDGVKVNPVGLSLTTNSTDDSERQLVDWGDSTARAFADGQTEITLFAAVRGENNQLLQRGKVRFRIKGTHAKFSGNEDYLSNSKTQAILDLAKDTGYTAKLAITSAEMEESKIIVELLGADSTENDSPEASELNYSFGETWFHVPTIRVEFPGSNVDRRYIYANDLHSVDLRVSVEFADFYGNPIQDHLKPKDPFKDANLISFEQADVLGTGVSEGWTCEPLAENPFTTPIPPNNREGLPGYWGELDAITPVRAFDANKTYSIRCAPTAKTSSYQFGFEITPTARQVVAKSDYGNYTYRMAEDIASKSIRFWAFGIPLNEDQMKTITTMPKIQYCVDDFDTNISVYPDKKQNDKGTSNPSGRDNPENYWRQRSCTVTLKKGDNENFLSQCRVSNISDIPKDYSIKSIAKNLFYYKMYFWPINVYDNSGNNISVPGERIVCGYNDVPRRFELNARPGELHFEWYANFSGCFPEETHQVSTEVKVDIYDQYGNFGSFTITGASMPTSNTQDDFDQWKILQEGTTNRAAGRALSSLQRVPNDIFLKDNTSSTVGNQVDLGNVCFYTKNFGNDDSYYYLTVGKKNNTAPKSDLSLHVRDKYNWPGINGALKCNIVTSNGAYPAECNYMHVKHLFDILWFSVLEADIVDQGSGKDNFNGLLTALQSDSLMIPERCKYVLSPVWETGEIMLYSEYAKQYCYCNGETDSLRMGVYDEGNDNSRKKFWFSVERQTPITDTDVL
ncbi:Ig-like domain-containing protein [Ochrobactrum teleogrylli]|uniref:Big-1 domain-containing protein n=1 Tax=Ochrobactrum teleogrylli TaxID=2479765 RepID=A0ABY2Y4A6_9HYPH|nr:Ig-like domain-containing protein [[Ochrobactrum] teleogrylli]TNV13867.1 hypothetical protein FIC94_14780 [[Ochrobactrum] teleogrylli]